MFEMEKHLFERDKKISRSVSGSIFYFSVVRKMSLK